MLLLLLLLLLLLFGRGVMKQRHSFACTTAIKLTDTAPSKTLIYLVEASANKAAQ